jgi:cobalt-zinc-cadmium efflux system protein
VLVAVSVYLIVEAVRRILDPQPVEGLLVIGFASAGLVINALSAGLLRSHLHDLNLRAAFLHLVGDAATSLAVIISGVIVWIWDWNYADPIVSIVVSLWIGRAAFSIVKSAVNVLMEGTPKGVEFADVEEAILKVPGVAGVHDLHIWSISSTNLALSAHLELGDTPLPAAGEVLVAVKEMLAHDFGIGHATIEPEPHGTECAGSTCDVVPRGLTRNGLHDGHSHGGHSHPH